MSTLEVSSPAGAVKRRPARILLVEDDESFAALVRAHLRSMGLDSRADSALATVTHHSGAPKLDTATSLAAARERLANREYDLIIADLNLPDSSGLETLKALTESGGQLILVLTGEEESHVVEAALDHGAYDFLPKMQMSPEVLHRLLRLATIQASTVGSLRESEARLRKAALEQQAHIRYQGKLAGFGQVALSLRDPGEIAAEAVQMVLEALGADAVGYLERGAGGEVVLRAVVGLLQPPATAVQACPEDSVLARVLATGEPALVKGGGLPPFEWVAAEQVAALAPVRDDDAVRGVLFALGRSPDAFGAAEQRLIEVAASVLSAGLRRIESEVRLSFLAQFDSLTGLPNRALLSDRFGQMIMQAKRHNSRLGVLFIDLDDFKMVNDTLGHAAGDELLNECARRLQASVRPGDTVARISGDEFAVILADLARDEDAALVAQKAIARIAQPITLRGQEVFVTASVGIALYPANGDSAETLIGAADAAMYRAKQGGRNGYHFFTSEINQRTRARAQLGGELHRALDREEFMLVYQAKLELRSGRPVGAEALLRWRHPERGMVSPADFIPVLEETGLIVPVGEWVLRRACDDSLAWRAAGAQALPVAVNLSARQFRQADLDARIRRLVEASGVGRGMIELEITESHLMVDPEHAARVMRSLADAGIRVAIDDFGTGYSSLAYLTTFPVYALKIDRGFVARSLADPAAAAIVRAVVELAHTLGFTVVAEGVETEEQASFLRELRCDQAQGYLFCRPLPAGDFRAWLATKA